MARPSQVKAASRTNSPQRAANIAKHRAERLEFEAAKQATRENNAAWRAKRTDAQQIAELDDRLGKDAGAVKERLRLKGGA